MYPEHLVLPMKTELTSVGFTELKSAAEVDAHFKSHTGLSLIVVNSVCGCAAGAARPGVKLALAKSEKTPEFIGTVFAGFDLDAVEKVREYCLPYPPSSPAVALFKGDQLIHFVERHHIEGRTAEMIAEHLMMVFEEYC